MKNDIEDFINKNRADFDDLTPNEQLWNEIEKSVPHNPATSRYLWLWKAAAIVFFFTSAFLYFQPFGTVDSPKDSRMARMEESKLNNELEQVESFYIQMISEKRSLISTFQEGESTEVIGKDYEEDLQKLGAMYEVLKKDFDNDPTKEVVDALVLNLLVRIDILNKTLAELDTEKEAVLEDQSSEINA